MYYYKRGDRCPFCGLQIPEEASDEMLGAITAAAAALNLPEPANPVPDILCELKAKSCPSGQYADRRCCEVCPEQGKCDAKCTNSATRCRQSDFLAPLFGAVVK